MRTLESSLVVTIVLVLVVLFMEFSVFDSHFAKEYEKVPKIRSQVFSSLVSVLPVEVPSYTPAAPKLNEELPISTSGVLASSETVPTQSPTSLRSVLETQESTPSSTSDDSISQFEDVTSAVPTEKVVVSESRGTSPADDPALEESAFDSPEELETVSKDEPEVRDASLSRFSKRFRMSNHYMKMKKYDQENLTYYPRDHMGDGQLWAIRKRLMDDEHSTLQSLLPTFHNSFSRYANFTVYLDTDESANIVSKEEIEKVQSLSGRAQSLYRKKLMTRVFRVLEKRHKQEKDTRMKLIRSQVRKNGRYCEGCKIKKAFSLRPSGSIGLILRKFKGNKEVFTIYNSTYYRYPPSDAPFNVTGVCVTTFNRLVILTQLLYRWSGPLVLVLNGLSTTEGKIIDYLNTHYLPDRLTILLYLMPKKGTFPVNLLRNLGIRNIETTHFQVLDMDLWPSTNTYNEIMKLPPSLQDGKIAVIFPVFFFDRKRVLQRCSTFWDCALLALEYLPSNKSELNACLFTRACQSSKAGIRTHTYVMPQWYVIPEDVSFARIQCLVTDFQEPYVLLRYAQGTPLFNERFVNYGYNKVQLFEHLRAAGYTFYILANAFAMDLPHPDSKYRKNYLSSLKGDNNDMRNVYSEFQRELNTVYRSVRSSKICTKYMTRYYKW